MRVKKTGKKIYGAEFTAAEKQAMDMEIERQLAVWDLNNAKEIASMSLWILHEEFGFGPDRLKRFFISFSKDIDELAKRYDMDKGTNDDKVWLCTLKLKEYGIDIEEWEKENKK